MIFLAGIARDDARYVWRDDLFGHMHNNNALDAVGGTTWMSAPRGEFSSKLGFILAAAGSAVGLGNIWGFPTQAASNGGAAFLLIYLAMAFCLAYPALMAELIIGRHAKANAVTALRLISSTDATRHVGAATGFAGIATASFILSFYAIVAGWMVAYCLAPLSEIVGMDGSGSLVDRI